MKGKNASVSTAPVLVTRMVTHFHPHADEMLAWLLILYFGQKRFHVASPLPKSYVTINLTAEMVSGFGDSTVFLGVGKGLFDDHGKEHEKSCCELVAEYLGIRQSPSVAKLVDSVGLRDKKSLPSKGMTLPRLISLAYRHGRESEEIWAWAFTAFQALIDSEDEFAEGLRRKNDYIPDVQRFNAKCKREFAAKKRDWEGLELNFIVNYIPQAQRAEWGKFVDEVIHVQQLAFEQAVAFARDNVQVISTPNGDKRVLIVDASSAKTNFYLEMDAASRARGVWADFLIVLNPKGNVMVIANPSAHTDIRGLVGAIRHAEAKCRGIVLMEEQLFQEGTADACPQWHVHEKIGFTRLYNGTTTKPDIEPTVLTLERIAELFIDWLNSDLEVSAPVAVETTSAA